MGAALWILALGLMPSLLSLWLLRRREAQIQARFRQAIEFTPRVRTQRSEPTLNNSDRYYLEGVGYLVGDISCRYNARSSYIRCAVNPEGPCEGCRYYEPR
ncbi:hypothetical protein B7486_45575 [cyanobacterium TDX16]|nr:hypothetical protein B7486_45575 [cyanobacterium TDX16]